MTFDAIKNKLHDRNQIERDLKRHQLEFDKKKTEYNSACAVETLFQEVTKEMQTELKGFLTEVNQQALDLVFPGYIFDIEFSTKNNTSSAEIAIINNGRSQKPMEANGGGLDDILALCSQMAAKKMGNTRNVIFADQPMSNLSKGEKEKLAIDMLKTLTTDMEIQYIMISHIDNQIDSADKTIKICIKDDPERGYPVSYVEK